MGTTLQQRDDWVKALLASGEHETRQRVGIRLALFLNIKTGRLDPSYAGISKALGGKPAEQAVMRAVKKLEERGWIQVTRTGGGRKDRRRGNTNSFALLPPPSRVSPGRHPYDDLKGVESDPSRVSDPDIKGVKIGQSRVSPGRHPNREENRESGTERESAARAPLSEAPGFENVEVMEGEILPPRKPHGQANGKPTQLPPDWQPDGEDWTYAADKGLTADDIEHEAERFRDWTASGGKTSHDWSAAWRRWVGNSRQHPRNRRRTAGERAAELAREVEAKEAAMRAAGIDPRSPYKKDTPPPAPEPKRNPPTWSEVLAVIRRKAPPGEAFNKAEKSFRLGSFTAGVLEIAVTNAPLYPPDVRQMIGFYICKEYPDVTDVRFTEG